MMPRKPSYSVKWSSAGVLISGALVFVMSAPFAPDLEKLFGVR